MDNTNNEIDLIELYQKALIFISQRFFTFVIFGVIGILFGSAYYYKKSDLVNTHFLAETTDISKELLFDLTDKLAITIAEKDYQFIEKKLNIKPEIINSINGLSIDTSHNIFRIKIISNNKESIVPFTKALVNYYNNQPFILESQQNRIEKTKFMLSKINAEIENIDKFQQKFLESSEGSNITINQINGSHTEKLQLYKMKQRCEEELLKKDAVQLINVSDNIIKKETSLLKTLVISLIISIFFAFLFLFIKYSIDLKNRGLS